MKKTSVFTVDFEDWYSPATVHFGPDFDGTSLESRVEIGTRKILNLLEKNGIKATFFVLASVAERVPELIREVRGRGHEIASHGYGHKMLTDMTPGEFRDDTARSIDIISGITGEKVRGYRAPSFTITEGTLWAFDVLASLGIEYDSSVYPISMHPNYGMAEFGLSLMMHSSGIFEVPLSCAEIFRGRIPCSGGGYFRLYPYAVFRALVKRVHRAGRPYIFYIHPWELDPGQPRQDYGPTGRFRQYQNLARAESRLECLLEDFKFSPLKDIIPCREKD